MRRRVSVFYAMRVFRRGSPRIAQLRRRRRRQVLQVNTFDRFLRFLRVTLLALSCSGFAAAERSCLPPEPARDQMTYCAEALTWSGERALLSLEAPRLKYMVEGQ